MPSTQGFPNGAGTMERSSSRRPAVDNNGGADRSVISRAGPLKVTALGVAVAAAAGVPEIGDGACPALVDGSQAATTFSASGSPAIVAFCSNTSSACVEVNATETGATGLGVEAASAANIGVYGSGRIGLKGDGEYNTDGVQGTANQYYAGQGTLGTGRGVYGLTGSGTGVRGESTANTSGVEGYSYSDTNQTLGSGTGVAGYTGSGSGVSGTSSTGWGGFFSCPGGTGLHGDTNSGYPAVYGYNGGTGPASSAITPVGATA
jgi:hypothetical protein